MNLSFFRIVFRGFFWAKRFVFRIVFWLLWSLLGVTESDLRINLRMQFWIGWYSENPLNGLYWTIRFWSCIFLYMTRIKWFPRLYFGADAMAIVNEALLSLKLLVVNIDVLINSLACLASVRKQVIDVIVINLNTSIYVFCFCRYSQIGIVLASSE